MTTPLAPIVVDASALVVAATDHGARGDVARAALIDHRRHAPHLVDAEVGNVMRKLVLNGTISEARARLSRSVAQRAVHDRHPHLGPIGELAWALRHNVTFYDGLYAALARLLDCPLVTANQRLALAVGSDQAVQTV